MGVVQKQSKEEIGGRRMGRGGERYKCDYYYGKIGLICERE